MQGDWGENEVTNQQPTEPTIQVGDVLHASCSDEDYATVTAVHYGVQSNIDDSVSTTVDLANVLLNDIVDTEWSETKDDVAKGYMHVDHDVRVNLYNVRVESIRRDEYGLFVVLDTPGNGCYRCTRLFSVIRKTVKE